MSKRSFVGTYDGFVEPVANGYVRTSEYVKVRDGTLIAVDILHPAKDGVPLGGPRPTVARGTGYRRSFRKGEKSFYDVGRAKIMEKYPVGAIITPYELAPNSKLLIDHGYNFVSIDFRGTGASFGQNTGFESGRDCADVIDWIASQPWSDGKIGTWGRSWEAFVQLEIAAAGPKHLTCMMPAAYTTRRNSRFVNGVYLDGFTKGWSRMRQGQDTTELACPVDGPDGEALRDEARAQAAQVYSNASVSNQVDPLNNEYFDLAFEEAARQHPHLARSEIGELRFLLEKMDQVNATGAATYLLGGWWDMSFVNDQMSIFNNLTVPKKMLIGPWTHSQFEFGYEPLRWFDYWLKGIENGIMDEAPIHYSTSDVRGAKKWYGADAWPLANGSPRTLHAAERGVLSEVAPPPTRLRHVVDHSITNGLANRTPYMFEAMHLSYPNLNDRASRCLSFETQPFEDAIEITGVPSIQLQLSCDQTDLALMVTLEQLDEAGNAYYLTEGLLNLKHRKVSKPPISHVEQNWHSELKIDSLPVKPGEIMDLAVDMFAVSCRLEKGCRLRIALAFSDVDNYQMPAYDPPAEVTVNLGGANGFRVWLPFVEPSLKPGLVEQAFQSDSPAYAFDTK